MENIYYYEFVDFISKTSLYPPSELCSGTYGKKAASKEKRLIDICEGLYRLDSQTLSSMRDSFKDFESMRSMSCGADIRPEYATKVAGKLLYFTEVAIKALEEMHKKDLILNAYYSEFKVTNKQVDALIREWVIIILQNSGLSGSDIHKLITESYKNHKESYK